MSVRELSPAETLKRIQALDALYANAERRQRELTALPKGTGYEEWDRAFKALNAAQREYERVRDTPYTLTAAPATDAAGGRG